MLKKKTKNSLNGKETQKNRSIISEDLSRVFYGGFIQSQILGLFSQYFEDETPQTKTIILERLLLAIRTQSIQDKILELNGFIDSGNKLKDPYSDKSIILVDKDKMNKISVSKPLFVPYNSLNNHGLLTCYKGFKIEIDGKSYDRFLIGISDEHFYMDGIDCIINNHVMEGLR